MNYSSLKGEHAKNIEMSYYIFLPLLDEPFEVRRFLRMFVGFQSSF